MIGIVVSEFGRRVEFSLFSAASAFRAADRPQAILRLRKIWTSWHSDQRGIWTPMLECGRSPGGVRAGGLAARTPALRGLDACGKIRIY